MVFIVWAQTSMLDSAWGGPSRPATPPVPLRSGAASLAHGHSLALRKRDDCCEDNVSVRSPDRHNNRFQRNSFLLARTVPLVRLCDGTDAAALVFIF